MVTGIIGKKVGMTQLFARGRHRAAGDRAQGRPVRRRAGEDGGDRRLRGRAARARRGEADARKTSRPQGHFKKAGVPPTRVRREVQAEGGRRCRRRPATRSTSSIFADGERVDVIGTSRGKGFQGVVKRHHFAGGRATHGSMFHRAPGSIGASSYPSRVVKGMRMAGHMGATGVTVRNLKVLRVDAGEQPAARRGRRCPAGRTRSS